MEGPVPDVDFSAFCVEIPGPMEVTTVTTRQREVGKQLYEILTNHGFVYAFGLLSSQEIAEVFRGSKGFFSPSTDRSALPRLTPATNVGYGAVGNEALNARRAGDIKEAFNLRKETLTDGTLNCQEGFPSYCHRVWDLCAVAAQRALLAFGVALGLHEPAIFARSLRTFDLCTLRLLRYPQSDAGNGSALPCGEHTDFGSVTVLLVEDGVPGLEVRTPTGGWISAPGKEGAVLLNTGAMLARWCNEHVKATPHRVVTFPARERYSVAFFCDPDKETVVEALPEFTRDTPAKFPPIKAEDYLQQCLKAAMHGELSEEAKKSLEI